MKTARQLALIRALLERALNCKNEELIKQYSAALIFIKTDYISALEKENALLKLNVKYKRGA